MATLRFPVLLRPGEVYGRLTVLEEAGRDTWGKRRYRFRCDCGEICYATGSNVRRGKWKSCGCLRRERLAARNRARKKEKE